MGLERSSEVDCYLVLGLICRMYIKVFNSSLRRILITAPAVLPQNLSRMDLKCLQRVCVAHLRRYILPHLSARIAEPLEIFSLKNASPCVFVISTGKISDVIF